MARDHNDVALRERGAHKRHRSRSRSIEARSSPSNRQSSSRRRSHDHRDSRSRTNEHHRNEPSPSRARHYSQPTPPQRPRHWFAKEYDPIQVGSIDGTDTMPHDKALVRALNASFDASRDPKIAGDPYKTLFVGRLNYTTTEETLNAYFTQFGKLISVRVVRDVVTQQSKGYAFVRFEREGDFTRAYHAAHRHEIDGRAILVDFERSRVMPGWKPRRFGGGLGGRKESGQLRFGGRDHPFKPPAR